MVVAIVVTYNRKKILFECISSLKKINKLNLRVIIIDNDSNDGTREFIEELIDGQKIIYINTGSNLGGAGGFSFGLKEAMKYECDFFWLMDDDCIVDDGTLSGLLDAAKELDGKFGFLSSVVKWKDGSLCEMNLSRNRFFLKVRNIKHSVEPIICSSFVSLFIPRYIVDKVGLPIKEFFVWADDWEYTRRISKQYKSYIVKGSTVIHKSERNLGGDISKDSIERIERYRYLYRNEVYLFAKEGLLGVIVELVRLCVHSLRVIFNKNNGKLYKLKLIWCSALKGLCFTPEIEYIQGNDYTI